MKKAFSLIELVFSIVVIGICLAALPKIIEASLKSDAVAFKQEYAYELKEFYGAIKSLPLSKDNICIDEFKNSLLSQYCIDKPADKILGYGPEPRLELINKNSRYSNSSNRGDCKKTRSDKKKCDTILEVTDKNIDAETTFRFAIDSDDTKYDPSKRFSHARVMLKDETARSVYDGANKIEALQTKKIQILDKVEKDSNGNPIVYATFYATFPRFGRVENIYSEYLLHTDDKAWNDRIEDNEIDMLLKN